MGSLKGFQPVMEHTFNGRIDPLINSMYPLETAREAFAHYERGEQFKRLCSKCVKSI